MKRQHTQKEIETLLKTMTIVVDTREQVWSHVESGLEKLRYPYERGKLNYGDYPCKLPDLDGMPVILSDEVVIERKANLEELARNFAADRKRFEAEFIRAKSDGVKVFLLIEKASWADIFCGNYSSGISTSAFANSLLSWQAKYNITVMFSRPEDSAKLIAGTLYCWLRARLKSGDLLCT